MNELKNKINSNQKGNLISKIKPKVKKSNNILSSGLNNLPKKIENKIKFYSPSYRKPISYVSKTNILKNKIQNSLKSNHYTKKIPKNQIISPKITPKLPKPKIKFHKRIFSFQAKGESNQKKNTQAKVNDTNGLEHRTILLNKNRSFSEDKDFINNNESNFSNVKDLNLTKPNEKKMKKKTNLKLNNLTLSGQIASRAKNLNKMMNDNFNNLKNPKTNSNIIKYNSTVSNRKVNNIFTENKRQSKLKLFAGNFIQQKKKILHKNEKLNRSQEFRNINNINDSINNKNNENEIKKDKNISIKERKTLNNFNRIKYNGINTSQFTKNKSSARKNYIRYNLEQNKIDLKKFDSPKMESDNLCISLNNDKSKSLTNSIYKKKRKIIKRKNNNNMNIDNKDKVQPEKNLKDNKDDLNENEILKIKKPERAQSQREITSELIIDKINNILEKHEKNEKNKKFSKKIEKKITGLQSLCKKGFAGPGVQKENQDNFFIYNNFNNNKDYIYMGVCDGHGIFGQDVSGYLVNVLPQNMNTEILDQDLSLIDPSNKSKLFKTISNTFKFTNDSMNEEEKLDSAFSGSTCVSIFYTPVKLICANLGDSRAIIGSFDGVLWKANNLSRDHKPSEQDEYSRIISSGGRVESYKDEDGNYIGPERVWLKFDDVPGLAMSRSFGDQIAHTVGVIAEPEINEYYFNENDKFIILASDGIWEFISSEECVMMVKDFYINNDIEGALNYLYKESSKRWILEEEIIDDITILIAFLK